MAVVMVVVVVLMMTRLGDAKGDAFPQVCNRKICVRDNDWEG
jgi:hypothetical protein